jgi:hypothetical protein
MLVGADRRVMPMLCAIALAAGSCDGECCGMVIISAAATGLPRCGERVRAAAAAADEQPGQGRGDLALRHELLILQRQLGPGRAWFTPADRRCWRRCCTGFRSTCSRDCTWWCAGYRAALAPRCGRARPPAGPAPAPGPAAASTFWEILHEAGIDPAPDRSSTTWADFLRSQAEAPLACPSPDRHGARLVCPPNPAEAAHVAT